MLRLLALAVTALSLALLLAGCDMVFDGDQIRVCRQTLPAVNPDASKLVLERVDPAPPPYAIRLSYRAAQDGRERRRFVDCAFTADPLAVDKDRLTAFATDEEFYSPIKLHILNRYWLEKKALAASVDPGPGESAVAIFVVSQPTAYLIQALANALPPTAVLMLIAVAYSLIYGLVGRINLAFGEMAVLGAYGTIIGSTIATQLGVASIGFGLVTAAVVGIAVACLHGRLIERLVFTPLAFGRGQSILIATLGLAIVLQEYMRLSQGARDRWLPPLLSVALPIADAPGYTASVTLMQILVAVVAAVLALVLVAVMRWSAFGQRWRAVADDPRMASLLGVSASALLAQTFLIATGLAGAAGFILTAYYGGAGFASGTMIGLKALVAAVVGGIGSVGGALLGGLAIGVFEALWSAYLPIEQRDLAVLSLLAIVLALRPGGIFGLAEERPRQV